MGKIIFIISVLLLALIFQKNPVWGMFAIGIYILYKFRSRRINSNKGLIDSSERNTDHIVFAMAAGFQTIADAMKGEDTELYYDNDKKSKKSKRGYYKDSPAGLGLLQN